jgi:hypothetical protein
MAILLSSCVHSLLLPNNHQIRQQHQQSLSRRKKSCIALLTPSNPNGPFLETSLRITKLAPSSDDLQTASSSSSSYHRLINYASHWTQLLQLEHKEAVDELKYKRSTWSRARLESAGISLFNVCAEPDGEMYGEKIIRLFHHNNGRGEELEQDGNNSRKGSKRKITRKATNWSEKFNRGDVLIITPQESFRGKDPYPKEGLVTDVGSNYILVGVGASYPVGLFEMRKHSGRYMVRVDRSAPMAPLKAQRIALDKLRLGKSAVGAAAVLLTESFHNEELDSSEVAVVKRFSDIPHHFDGHADDLQKHILDAMEKTKETTTFEPNESQREAVLFALSRSIGLIRGPPGTGKTRVASLLISTALKMKLNRGRAVEDNDNEGEHPRILAVTHSNGAADVLLQALLDQGVPAVRLGRPASVSPSVQHRTIVALSERMPEVIRLRQIASNPSEDLQDRQTAAYDVKQYTNDVQTMIMKTAPVIVTSCIGAQQLLSDEDESAAFPIVVLDEAAQTTEPALMCALTAAGADQLIMVGDTKQLPPTVTSQNIELRNTIGTSPMERLMKSGAEEFVLKEQYRMPAALLKHPNEAFYDGAVKCAVSNTKSCPKGFPWPNRSEPLAFIEVGNNSEVSHNFGGRSNPTEVALVCDIVLKLISDGDVRAENIAIITPYSKQVQLIRAELNSASIIYHGLGLSDIQVGSVDSFQGQEKDIVIFSAVRSNLLKELGFLRDARRLNVAITRAKRGLVVLGDGSVLKTCRHWAALLNSCHERGCSLTESEYYCAVEIEEEEKRVRKELAGFELDKEDEYFGLF